MAARLDVTLTNSLSELERLAGLVEEFLDENALPMGLAFKINLCLDELITNTISYGYADDRPHDIEVGLELDGTALRITLNDDGAPFDPFSEAPAPDLVSDVEDRPIGGLGVYLVSQTMDRTDYRREGDRNVVTLVKETAGS